MYASIIFIKKLCTYDAVYDLNHDGISGIGSAVWGITRTTIFPDDSCIRNGPPSKECKVTDELMELNDLIAFCI